MTTAERHLEIFTDAALVQMIGHRDVRAEILRRVQRLGNVANTLAFRFLWPVDIPDRDDARDGLAGCCWKAKGNLLIPRFHFDGRMMTEDVLAGALDRRLAVHKKSGKRTTARLALRG